MMRSETTREENMKHYWHAYLPSLISLVIICFLLFVGTVSGSSVNLILPENNTITNLNNDSLQFVYNHTGSLAGIVNCTLYIDENPVNYSTDVPANTSQSVYSNQSWSEGTHYWYVNCTNGTSQKSSFDIGQNYTFTADFTPPNITSWYTNATNASSPQDLMFLVSANDSIFFNITVENPDNDTSYTWLVNKVDQNNSASNFTFNVPDCDHQNDPSSCIWEIHVIANDSAGNEAHHEWVISTLNESEAPDVFDYFTDGKLTNRAETDPWGRPLINWTIYYGTPNASRGYILGKDSSWRIITPSEINHGTWIWRYRWPAGFVGYDESSPVGVRFDRAYELYDSNDWYYKFAALRTGIGTESVDFPIDRDSDTSNDDNWYEARFIRTAEGEIYLFRRWRLGNLLSVDKCPADNIDQIELWYAAEGTDAFVDNIEVYEGKYLFPFNGKDITFGNYVSNYHGEENYRILPTFKRGIVIRGRGVRLEDIANAIKDTSKFTYDSDKRKAVCYTNLSLEDGSELIIENETLKFHPLKDGDLEFTIGYGATLRIENSTITSDTLYYYVWNFAGSTTRYGRTAFIPGTESFLPPEVGSVGLYRIYIENSTISNAAHFFLDEPQELRIKNSQFTNLSQVDWGDYSIDWDHDGKRRAYAKGKKALGIFTKDLGLDTWLFDIGNITISGKDQPVNLFYVMNNNYTRRDKFVIYDCDFSKNTVIKIKKSAHYHPRYWGGSWPPKGTYYDCRVELANCKWDKVNITTDKAYLIPKYYLDVKVIDSNGPVSGANVSVYNEVDDESYPCENKDRKYEYVVLPQVHQPEYKTVNLNYHVGLPHRSTLTTENGHTPLPSDVNNTLVIADYKKYLNLTTNETEMVNFTYTIMVNKTTNQGNVILKNTTNTIYPNGTIYYSENKNFSGIVTGVDPNESWYRANPLNPTYTVNITITTGDEVNMSVNSSEILNLTMNEYSTKLINFTATNTTTDQKMNITVYNGTFIVVNGKKYEIKKDGVVQQTKTAVDNKVVFTDIPVGSDYVITEESGGKEHKLPVAKPVVVTGIAILIVIAYWRYRRRRRRMRSGGFVVLVPGVAIEWSSFLYN